MKIGILVTGHALDELQETRGDYDRIFAEQLAKHGLEAEGFFVVDEKYPDSPADADGWLITGSKHGAYEDHPWIPPLEDFIRAVHADGRPMVGVCFGHQIIAQALGGKVEKFKQGWAVGHTDYEIDGDKLRLLAWHQDQVVERPEGARVIGSNEFCENAALIYGNQILTIQPHPEFDDSIVEMLLDLRARGVVDEDRIADARAQLGSGHDSEKFFARIAEFFKEARKNV